MWRRHVRTSGGESSAGRYVSYIEVFAGIHSGGFPQNSIKEETRSMPKTLAMLHTTPVTAATMPKLAAEELPGVRVINLLDDSLLQDVIAAGEVTPAVTSRILAYVDQMATAGADAVLCCCSSVGEVAELARRRSSIPVLRIDEPMAAQAVEMGERIGVIATVATTMAPTVRLIERKAAEQGRSAAVEPLVVEGAYEALLSGDGPSHDRLVREALSGLLSRSDVVVLAQASIARVLAALPEPPAAPVLTSPRSGLAAVGELFRAMEDA